MEDRILMADKKFKVQNQNKNYINKVVERSILKYEREKL